MTKDEHTKLLAQIAAEILAQNNHVEGVNLQLDANLIRGTLGGAVIGAVELAQMIVERATAYSDYLHPDQ